MAVTAKVYNAAITSLANSEIDWAADTIKVALCTSTYTPSQTTHDYFDDITNELPDATGGYTAGGDTLTTKTEAFSGQVKQFDADDAEWLTSTLTARYAIVYKSTGTASTSPLICYVDFGEDVQSSGGTYTIAWDSTGIFTVTVS